MNIDLSFNSARECFQQSGIIFDEKLLFDSSIAEDNQSLSNPGLLISDQNPYITKAAVFQDETMLVWKNRKEFSGSVFTQIEKAFLFIDWYNVIISDRKSYPEDAVYAALISMALHRNYKIESPSIIKIFPSRIEFVSIGNYERTTNSALLRIFTEIGVEDKTSFASITDSYAGYNIDPHLISGPNAFKIILPNINRN